MLRFALRSTSLWKCDSFIWTQTSLFYKVNSFAASPQLGRKNTLSLKQIRFYNQHSSQDAVDRQAKQTTDAVEVSDQVDRTPFSAHLQKCSCPSDVLDAVKHFPASHNDLSSIFTRMRESTKKMTAEQQRCELQLMFEHPGFREVCDRVVTDAWRMRCDDLAYTLLAIINLGVSQHTRIVQTLLRVIQERLNQFDIRSLSVLAAGIQQMENGNNVQALREALGLLLKDRVPEIGNVVVLQNMMRAVGKNSPKELKMQLAIKTLSLADEFSPPNTQYVFSSLAAMELNFKPLLNVCSKNIAENVHEFPISRLVMVLKSCYELQYRNYSLFSSISEYMTNTFDMWSNKKVILLLLTFEDLCFRPVQLLDAFAERIIQKPDSLTLKDLLSVLKVFSMLNHELKERKTEFLDCITKVLESYLSKMTPSELLKVNYYLALMEHFHQMLLNKLMQQETLEQLLQTDKPSNKALRWLHTINLCLQLDKPQLLSSTSSKPQLNITVPAFEATANQEMLSAVRSIVGTHAVQDSVVEQSMYFIDCVITLPGEKEETCGLHEDCGSPECNQRIAVICTQPNSFCFGTTHPRASLVMKLRHLEKLGYQPVLVPINELNSKTEEEKIKMLRRLIFSSHGSPESQKILHNGQKTEDIS